MEQIVEDSALCSRGTRSRWIHAIEWILLGVLTAYLCVHTLPAASRVLNTDFPNYYLTARLAREKSATSRIYEWVWLQRQKDHRGIDQRIVGLIPITPFSTLATWPIARLRPLAAKRLWLAFNLVLVVATALLIQRLTQLPWRQVLLVFVLSMPLNKNFLFGQYYLLLLFFLALACWCYVREKRLLSGLLIGLSFGLKLFPIVYLAYFLRRKDFKAFFGGVVGSSLAVLISIAVFGEQVNKVLLAQVLPWSLRGEGMNPYDPSTASIATLLHRSFIYEPQWNPHPTVHAAWAFAILLPLMQTVLFAPAILLVDPKGTTSQRTKLEWSAILLASLAISTLPAGYHFTLLILPVCLIWEVLQERRSSLIAPTSLLLLFAAIGYPGWKDVGTASHFVVFSVPRLYLVVALTCFSYRMLTITRLKNQCIRSRQLWVGAFVLMTAFAILMALRHQKGLYEDYRYRLPTSNAMLQTDNAVTQGDTILSTAMLFDGYHTAIQDGTNIQFEHHAMDELAVTANTKERWREETGRESTIVSSLPSREVIHNAEAPVASYDGRWLAYLREEHGYGQIWLRTLERSADGDKLLTPVDMDVFEMTFLPNGSLIFSAQLNDSPPRLFIVDQMGITRSLGQEEVRYPAVSPDGHWLAFDLLQGGNWHLWLRDLRSGQTNRLTDADCNNVEPSWVPDSSALIYGSDCGRSLWFTVLCRRTIQVLR
ncbi:glycosyltransferase 87 family protein [Granulicella sp. S190]|uniref:glycosyltransferase 87 family protein n=1 Tax=Granulicella sp. S190 TaxID=1747226 RepID=UPI00131B9527|nr:glycosyltransferase 87 family protein [Granulicella sp. S190]